MDIAFGPCAFALRVRITCYTFSFGNAGNMFVHRTAGTRSLWTQLSPSRDCFAAVLTTCWLIQLTEQYDPISHVYEFECGIMYLRTLYAYTKHAHRASFTRDNRESIGPRRRICSFVFPRAARYSVVVIDGCRGF